MADRLKEIPGKVLEWWNKFTNRQKTIIVAIVAIVIFTFVILIWTFTRPIYTVLGTYDTNKEASEIVDLLKDAGIGYRLSDDARTIEVEADRIAEANYVLGANGYMPGNLSYSDWVESSMTTTSSDRNNQYTLFLQEELRQSFLMISAVKDVSVRMYRAPEYGTLMDQQQESSAYIQLTLRDTFSSAQAATMARAAATFLGSQTLANITIVDQDGNALFIGGDDYTSAGVANSLQELQNTMQSIVSNQVRTVFFGTGQYDMIQVTSHLDMDFSEYQDVIKEYYTTTGDNQGYYAQRDTYNETSSNGVDGIPGTDSNDGNPLTGYVYPDYASSESEVSEESIAYLLNELHRTSNTPSGVVNLDNSSMAIAMISYREYHEETVRSQGLLDGGLSWEDFKAANSGDIRLEVDPDFYLMAENATGISRDRITIVAYESPIFYDREGLSISGTDILSIVMIVLILALLGFVVLRSMGSRKEVEEEEELSVESMLQSTPESTLEDIDVETKSETRKMVEKFVDDNPEAAAILLRNWLNEDWS